MAYNKTKYVDGALKYLHQGKLAQAIGEYQQILKHEPKDQITLMTVGDLFVRQGDTFQALEYFERLAQIYLADGFVTKAIAIYKKIAKLAPEENRPVEKLAELYVQQGVLSEARPIYLQLAEMHQRASRPVQAAGLLKKLLDAEPDNLRAQAKLAEVSLAAGLKAEAVGAYIAAARSLLGRGDHAEALKNIDRALAIEPNNLAATALKVRIHAANGQQQQAMSMLEKAADIVEGNETTTLLLDLYIEAGENAKAAELASKVFAHNTKHFAPALRIGNTYIELGDVERALVLLDLIREAMTDAGEHEALSQALTRAAERFPDRIESLQWLVELYARTSDSFRLPDALANLAKAHEKAGRYNEALKAFEELLDRDPEKESVRGERDRLRKLAGVKEEPGQQAQPASGSVENPLPGSESAGAAAPPEAGDEETERFLAQALTDVDLFSSYGLTQKAMDLLESVLNRAPNHTVALERLLDLYLGAGNERRTAELAARLDQVHRQNGDNASADRFAELCRRYEKAAGPAEATVAPTPVPSASPAEFTIPIVDSEPLPEPEAEPPAVTTVAPEADSGESTVHEVDLSEEWAALAESATLRDEGQDASLADVAREAAMAVDAIGGTSEGAESDSDYVLELDPTPDEALSLAQTEADKADQLGALAAELDAALPKLTNEPQQRSAATHAAASNSPAAAASSQPPTAPVETAGPLSDVFNEFRADIGDSSSTESEDLETHYNLGIAYREMGLLEEAISEFQKVAKANNTGRAFRYAMQCCTLLGLAFMERGEPAIAAMWYERALETPGLDQETILALRYDLGVAQELAGDATAARKSFSQVYGMNIDYRDVGERLAALGKAQR